MANSLILQPALLAGAYLAVREVSKGNRIEFGFFFKGFDFIGQLALVVLVTSLIIFVCFIPFGIVAFGAGFFEWFAEAMQNPVGVEDSLPVFTPVLVASFLLSSALALYFGVAYTWSSMFVVFYKMPFWDAMETSRKLITKKWFIFFLFSIVVGVIVMLGVILLCVGLLATFPAALCMQYAAFEDVTKLNQDPSEDMFIEQHLIVD